MKKLEDLKISPWPWKCAANDCGELVGVLNRRGFYVAKFAYDIRPNDAWLISAVPELYEALRGLLEIVCIDCGGEYKVDGKCVKCPRVIAAEAALAKAAGERDWGVK